MKSITGGSQLTDISPFGNRPGQTPPAAPGKGPDGKGQPGAAKGQAKKAGDDDDRDDDVAKAGKSGPSKTAPPGQAKKAGGDDDDRDDDVAKAGKSGPPKTVPPGFTPPGLAKKAGDDDDRDDDDDAIKAQGKGPNGQGPPGQLKKLAKEGIDPLRVDPNVPTNLLLQQQRLQGPAGAVPPLGQQTPLGVNPQLLPVANVTRPTNRLGQAIPGPNEPLVVGQNPINFGTASLRQPLVVPPSILPRVNNPAVDPNNLGGIRIPTAESLIGQERNLLGLLGTINTFPNGLGGTGILGI